MRYTYPPLPSLTQEQAVSGVLNDYLQDLAPRLAPLGIARPVVAPGCDLEHAARLLAYAALGPDLLPSGDVQAIADAVRSVVGDVTDPEGVPRSLASVLARAALVRSALSQEEDLTTSDVAAVLGISAQRVRQLGGVRDYTTGLNVLERAPCARWTHFSCRRLFRTRGIPWPELG